MTRALHVLIIGGGASGVLQAAHLLAAQGRDFRVTLVEPRERLGLGLAYSTRDPDHLLNTRVLNMSAFGADPDHFRRWLHRRGYTGFTEQSFVRRAIYGSYLGDVLAEADAAGGAGRLAVERQAARRLVPDATGVTAVLDDGRSLRADIAVLATGHVLPHPDLQGPVARAWDRIDLPEPEARVVIIGSGLSMVDQVLSLLAAGHRGEILALSRRGLLPQAHAATRPLRILPEDVPFGAPMSHLMRWLRGMARAAVLSGGTWRDAVDGVRPHIQTIWRALPMAERARFLRHAATLWEVHRHRIPPQSEAILQDALARGQLRLERAAYLGAQSVAEGVAIAVRRIGQRGRLRLIAARAIDCRGIRRDPLAHASPLYADLLGRGELRVDPLAISIEVDRHCRTIGKSGTPATRLFAIGPVSRATFWEITAIPDIREQTANLAEFLSDHAPNLPARFNPEDISVSTAPTCDHYRAPIITHPSTP